MKIAFYKGKRGTWQDKVICFATSSEYSHVELVLDDGTCMSSSKRDGGVRCKVIELGEKWHVYELNQSYDAEAIRYWFSINNEDTYDWWGAVASGFGIDWPSDDKKYCSQVIGAILGFDSCITPGELFRKLVREKLINE